MRKILSLAFLFCISCSVGENYVPPKSYSDATLAQNLNISAAKPLPQKWYTDFADVQLTALVEQGLKNNTDIKTAILRLKQARTQLQITKVAALPQINAQGGYNYDKQSKNIGITADSHYYSAGLNASWDIDIWGKNRRQIEADRALLKAAEYTLENVKILIAAEIISAYINLRQNSENLRLTEKNARLQQEILNTVKSKYNNGLTDETAYSEAQYLLENTRAQIPQYRIAIEQYRNALATLIGVLPNELPLNDTKLTPLSTSKITAHHNLREFPASAVRFRPDVAAAEQNLIAENALVGAAVAELYPNISLSGLWGYAAQGGSNLIRPNSQTYNYAPLISLPLLDWNRLQNNVRLQKYIKAEALADYKQTVLDAVSEIKNAQTAFYENRAAAQNKARALQNMRKAAELTQKKYESGLIEFSQVVRTQQNLITAEQDYVAVTAQVLQNLTAFYKAVAAPIN
jgi:NodT family efflux transporter outer membrane factor (OMF) lipoprotein